MPSYLWFVYLPLLKMINRKQLRKTIQNEVMKSGLVRWIEKEVLQTNLDLSDEHCYFHVNSSYELRGLMMIIEAVCTPKVGVFEGIEFRPKVFVNSSKCMQRPKIYNNRRVFHPNINALTCEIVSKELVGEWNPTMQFSAMLRQLKYLIIQPNCHFVPNNQYNRKAAWNYHFNKKNYRQLVIANSPKHLDSIVAEQLAKAANTAMDLEYDQASDQSQYWSIDRVIQIKHIQPSKTDYLEKDSQDESIELLSKGIKRLCFSQNEETPSI